MMTPDNCPFTVTVLDSHDGTLRLSVEIPEGNAPEHSHYEPDGYGDDGTQGEHVTGRSWGDATWPSDERIAAEAAKQLGHLVANVRFFDAADGRLDEAIYHAEAEPCLGGADAAEPCSAPATTLRCIDGDTSVALCAEHAAQIDIAEVGGVYYCASLADGHLYVSPVRGQPAPWRPVGETTGDGGVALAEAIAPDAQAVLDPAALAGAAAKAALAMRAAGLVYEAGAWGPALCQCGTVREDGHRCDVALGDDRVTVAYVPGSAREQARRGVKVAWQEVACSPSCAAALMAEQPRWARIYEPDTRPAVDCCDE